MNRSWVVGRLELSQQLKRASFWVLVILLGVAAFELSKGEMTINTGDASVGGDKAWITSQFAMAFALTMEIFLLFSFFIAIAAGTAVSRDEEARIQPLLHSTPLRPGDYIWGKFTAVLVAFLGVLSGHLLLTILFNHVIPDAKAADIRGPFVLANYLVPALVFGVPLIVFLAGTSFAIGERSRRPVLVFLMPLALLVLCMTFLWDWSPSWLDPRINRLLGLADPAGFRWLNETWLRVDRGVKFYNEGRIGFDGAFLFSRLMFIMIGLGAVAWSHHRFGATLRSGGENTRARKRRVVTESDVRQTQPLPVGSVPGLTALGMRMTSPGLLRGTLEIVRVEVHELLTHPALYLFIPIIIMQATGEFVKSGPAEAPILSSPGFAAVSMMNTLSLLICLLLLFFTIESLQRDFTTGMAGILHACPMKSFAILAGKTLANSIVGGLVLLIALLTTVAVILVQATVPLNLSPFLVVWGLLMIPTFLVWTGAVTAIYSISRNRYATYALAVSIILISRWLHFRDHMNWVGNWNLWSAVHWSDMGLFELDRSAIILNRLFVLSLAVAFIVLAVRFFPRTVRDPLRIFHRLAPAMIGRTLLRFSPFLIVPLVLGISLWIMVEHGPEGEATKKKMKDYWRQNLATWRDAQLPDLVSVDVNLDLEPAERFFSVSGEYRLANRRAAPLRQVALTGGPHWRKLVWTLNGLSYQPEDRSGLYIFTPPAPLAENEDVTIGFSLEGSVPDGITKDGGRVREFILPSGVVLTSFSPSFVPVLGFIEDMGVDKDNRYEPRTYPDDFYTGLTEPMMGTSSAFTTMIRITVPADYTANSVGVLIQDETKGDRRTQVWQSDQPVRFFNVIAGRWATRQGEGTEIFYHPAHDYNITEMLAALDGARRYCSEWFFPFPWQELKLSEFPALSFYAQGFPTNITFSEGIGFLTKTDPRANAAFAVAAHESAHQWWGNLVTPGKGPGGNVVSEGLAQYTTIMLFEQVKGDLQAQEFRKRIEARYGNERHKDAERPLVKMDESRLGDEVVLYEKGAWTFFMLGQLMGREAMFAGLHDVCTRYNAGPDYPVLQDILAVLREHTADHAVFDAFVQQWFFDVVVPEYKIVEASRSKIGDHYDVQTTLRNDGSGIMSVEIAATRGERLLEDGTAGPDYQESRATVRLGPGEEQRIEISCDFEPDQVLVDPDVLVLQLSRNKAFRRF